MDGAAETEVSLVSFFSFTGDPGSELVTCRAANIEDEREVPVAVASAEVASDKIAVDVTDELSIVEFIPRSGTPMGIETGHKLQVSLV